MSEDKLDAILRRLEVIEAKLGIDHAALPDTKGKPPADDGWGRRRTDELALDRMCDMRNPMSPGRLYQSGRIAPAPNDHKAWNDGGRR